MAKTDGKKARKASAKAAGESKSKGAGEPRAKGAKKAKPEGAHGLDALAKLAEHPLVTDLLAVGAMAAVAAIAERGVASKTGQQAAEGSRKAVKAAGKAAAAAIGQRLLKEVGGFGSNAAKTVKKV